MASSQRYVMITSLCANLWASLLLVAAVESLRRSELASIWQEYDLACENEREKRSIEHAENIAQAFITFWRETKKEEAVLF
jgi:hypothetical protein